MGLFGGIKKAAKAVGHAFYIVADKIRRGFVKVKNALTRFYNKALSFMKKVLDKVKTKVRGVIMGAAHFFRKVGNKYQEGTKNYSVDEEVGEWQETVITQEIEEEDIPPKYRTLNDEFFVDGEFYVNDTKELDEVIELAV